MLEIRIGDIEKEGLELTCEGRVLRRKVLYQGNSYSITEC
jgi:hypothetical protein